MRGNQPGRAVEAEFARAFTPRPGECLVVAVSGGADSVALAALAAGAARAAEATVVLAHVNHGVRERAWQDEAVVLAAGTALGARVVARSLEPGARDEARLRGLRYVALADIARTVGATRVLTAHHAQDQTETVLLALFRGTSPSGLAGIAPERRLERGLTLARPLLGIAPERLRAYCIARDLPYALDASNADTRYRRNALRRMLAELRRDFPGLDEAVARCAAIGREETAGTQRAATRRRLRESLMTTLGSTSDVTFERLDAMARSVERKRPGRHFVRRGVEILVRENAGSHVETARECES